MVTYDMVVSGAHVVTPTGIVEKNIVINEEKISLLTTNVPPCDKKIKADGLVAIPGVIDTHVHYGVYSPIDRAASTESHAAAIGGVTTMMRMLRLGGSYKKFLGEQLEASKEKHYIDYAIHASIFDHLQAEEMDFCARSGVTSFKLYMNLGSEIGHVYMDMSPSSTNLAEERVEVTDDIVDKVIANAARMGCPVLVHAEDYESCSCGIKTAKKKNQDGLVAWSESRSPKYEVKAIGRVSTMARKHGCIIYFVHIGSAAALEKIRIERMLGTKIFVETCPHYLTLSHENQTGYLAKVMPPIRTKRDREAVWEAICSGEINTIGTDHVANQIKLKLDKTDENGVWGALAGFPGIGTLLPVLASRGVNTGKISLERLANLTSFNAAKIFSFAPHKGAISIDADADITILDMKLEKKVSSELFGGFSDYTVYDGWKLKGWPVKTIVRGSLIAEDFEIVGKMGHGKFAPRTSIKP
ncbi:MAG: Dihydropyrimidinase [Cenarchaeum symbiont of Oopsacas minuta]|nr:Dihydropyrimidinase [Cenarchaeum symbiont of Oopsacas minuta]